MYQILLPLHSAVRWLLVIGLAYCLSRGLVGLIVRTSYNRIDNFFRGFTSGVSHLQLIIGLVLYFKSPITTYFRQEPHEAIQFAETAFFGVFHISCMIIFVLLVTVGASRAKKATTDFEKHQQVFSWFGVAVVFIILGVPWPFNSYSPRPLIRAF